MRAPLAALVLVVAACAVPAADPAPTVPASTATTTTATTPGPDLVVEECGEAPPVDFAVLCRSFEAIVTEYVDPIEPEALAAAAMLGLGGASSDAPVAEVPREIRCSVPHASFEQVCIELADRLVSDPVEIGHLVQAAAQGMFRYGLDPFSVYIPGSESGVAPDTAGLVVELGLVVGARDDTGAACGPIGGRCRFQAVSVFDFYAAHNEGIRVGDVILGIDGSPVEGLSGEEATALLHGNPGTSVELEVARGADVRTRTLVREDVRFTPTEFEMIGGIAYIRLNDFSQPSAQGLGEVLQLPNVESAQGLVLDLRDNPGGLVIAAQAVASQFLDGGSVLVETGRSWEVELPVVEGGLATTGPEMVVLVNRGTASAAEVVAAVLQERDRAVVMGEPTFGKNLVQFVEPSRDGGEIRLTVARWSTPGGLDIGRRGLAPDLVIEVPPDTEGDPVLEEALARLGG